jgi:glycosyltransferase involved in cell wall biosynthesis
VHLIEAVQQIIKQHPHARFLFIGDGPLRSKLDEQIRFGNVRDNIKLTGMVDRVDEILAGADFLVHAAVEEPFGFALIEGMRARLPIVASRVGGVPEVVQDGLTGMLVEPKRSDILAAAVGELLSDGSRMKLMGEAGYARWQKSFRLERMVSRVEESLQRLLMSQAGYVKT